jgi:hypothetical protein
MADGTQAYDYTQDPEFLHASMADQHSYLMANEPEYAKSPSTQQNAYLNHLKESSPPVAPTLTPRPVGLISGRGISAKEEQGRDAMEAAEAPSSEAVGRAAGGIGLGVPAVLSPVTTAASVAGGAVGAPIVSGGARRLTKALGGSQETQDTAGDIGGWAGLLGGGLLGGWGASRISVPEEVGIGGFKFKTPKFLNPTPAPTMDEVAAENAQRKLAQQRADIEAGVKQDPGVAAHAEMESDIANRKPPVTPITESPNYAGIQAARAAAREDAANKIINRPGWTARLPVKVPGVSEGPLGVTPETGMTGSEGRAATWTNEKVLQEAAQGNRAAIQQVSLRGLQPPPNMRYVMGDPDLERSVFNPREATTSETEGNIRNMSNPPKSPRGRIVVPKTSSPREVVKFGEEANISDKELADEITRREQQKAANSKKTGKK